MTESGKKNILMIAAIIVLLAFLVAGTVFFLMTNVIIEWKAYPKNAQVLNLRGSGISVAHYERVRQEFPNAEIYWDIPIQGNWYPDDTVELTIADITEEERGYLAYLKQLRVIHAEDCEDYALLAQLQAQYPNCQVCYTVSIDGKEYSQDAKQIELTGLTDTEVQWLDYLPQLEKVNAWNCQDYDQLLALQERRPECQVNYAVTVAGQSLPSDTREVELRNADAAELMTMLAYLPHMEKVRLVDPVSDGESVQQLRQAWEQIEFSCEVNFQGITLQDSDTEIDISGTAPESLQQVSDLMKYLPNAEKLIMTDCGFDNEAMAVFRESKRQDYKVVWTVMCGTIPVRTDEIFFHPIQEHVYYFFDEDAYNLRYCEDMICVDVGHMALHDISWVEYMPNLKYLILCLTTVLDITPLSTCKNLIFLELDMTGISDYTPLLGCTALEDLNLGLTYGDPAPIAQMTWLKNLWWKGKGGQTRLMLEEALPNTNMNFNPLTTSGGGWRKLQNYYDMRDILGMYYM